MERNGSVSPHYRQRAPVLLRLRRGRRRGSCELAQVSRERLPVQFWSCPPRGSQRRPPPARAPRAPRERQAHGVGGTRQPAPGKWRARSDETRPLLQNQLVGVCGTSPTFGSLCFSNLLLSPTASARVPTPARSAHPPAVPALPPPKPRTGNGS